MLYSGFKVMGSQPGAKQRSGSASWQEETAKRLGLKSTLTPLDRPRKRKPATEGSASLFTTSVHRSAPP
jgi:hypothetical protein